MNKTKDSPYDFRSFYESNLEGVEISGDQLKAWCPFHDDKKSKKKGFSANLIDGLWYCHSSQCGFGGNTSTFCKRRGIDPTKAPDYHQRKTIYCYQNGAIKIKNENGQSNWKNYDKNNPIPYAADQIDFAKGDDGILYIAEGEKDCETAINQGLYCIGIPSATHLGCLSNVDLNGLEQIILLYDNDDAGNKATNRTVKLLPEPTKVSFLDWSQTEYSQIKGFDITNLFEEKRDTFKSKELPKHKRYWEIRKRFQSYIDDNLKPIDRELSEYDELYSKERLDQLKKLQRDQAIPFKPLEPEQVLPLFKDYINELIEVRGGCRAIGVISSLLCTMAGFVKNWIKGDSIFGRETMLNIWALVIDRSASLKSTSLEYGSRFAIDYRNGKFDWVELDELKKPAPRFFPTLPSSGSFDGLIECLNQQDEGGMIMCGEFASWIANLNKKHNESMKAQLTDSFDGYPINKYTKQNKAEYVRHPCISINAASTFEWLDAYHDIQDVKTGFLARFLIFSSAEALDIRYDNLDRIVKGETTGTLPDEPIRKKIEMRFKKIFRIVSRAAKTDDIKYMRLTRPAALYLRDKVVKGYFEQRRLKAHARKDMLEPYYLRWQIYVYKVSCLLALLDITNEISHEKLLVQKKHVKGAFYLINHSVLATRYIIERKLGIPKIAREQEELYEFISHKWGGKIKRPKLLQSSLAKRLGGARYLDGHLDNLQQQGRLKRIGPERTIETTYYVVVENK